MINCIRLVKSYIIRWRMSCTFMLAMNKDSKYNSLGENLNFGVSQKNCLQTDSIFLSSDREPYFDLKLIFFGSVLVQKHLLRDRFSDKKKKSIAHLQRWAIVNLRKWSVYFWPEFCDRSEKINLLLKPQFLSNSLEIFHGCKAP